MLSDKEFGEELECYWQELKLKVQEKGTDGKITYWDFIGADTYEETVQRAFLTSFLITYGYATLEIDRLEETMFILPFISPKLKLSQCSPSQFQSPYHEDWQKWKKVNSHERKKERPLRRQSQESHTDALLQTPR